MEEVPYLPRNNSYASESRGALGLGLNVNAEGESATWTQSERNNSVKDSERNTNSSYASESRGALDLGLNAKAEGESATMAQSERSNSVNDRERTDNSSYASESRGALDLGLNAKAEGESAACFENGSGYHTYGSGYRRSRSYCWDLAARRARCQSVVSIPLCPGRCRNWVCDCPLSDPVAGTNT